MTASDQRFGKYVLLSKIAAGGMAVAYRAELSGAAGVKKRVVLKVIHPHLAEQQSFVEMFISEAKVAASLTHGNVAQVFDFGEVGGRYFLAMEEVVGQSLARVLKVSRERGYATLPIPAVLHAVVGLLDGLHYAHTRKDASGKPLNLVHRDVSPENTLLSYEGEVKVVDFGIAKTTEGGKQTETGMVKGKYPYFSPEQARAARDLDARTDVWAAGIVLYECICGRRPFEGEFVEVMRHLLQDKQVPSPRSLALGLDKGLEAILLKALAWDRKDRYASARDFSQAVAAYLHEHYPQSTRQDLQHLLVSLFPAEAAQEGADTQVPEDFKVQLANADAVLKVKSRTGEYARPTGRTPPPGAGRAAPLPRASPGRPLSRTPPGERRTRSVETRAAPEQLVTAEESKPTLPPVRAPAAAPSQTLADEDDGPPTLTSREGLPPAPPPPPLRDRNAKLSLDTPELQRKRQRLVLIGGGSAIAASLLLFVVYVVWQNLREPPKEQPVEFAQLWISSTPEGAEARVDGKPVGKLPVRMGVAVGTHTVAVDLPGHLPWTRRFTVRTAKETVNLVAELKPDTPDGGAPEPTAQLQPAPVIEDDPNLAAWPRRLLTLRPRKMALPLDEYTTASMELTPGTTYSFWTQGSLSLGRGRGTSTVLYFLDGDLPAAQRVGFLSPQPRAIRGASRIRIFALDDDASDNAGALKVVSRISQYIPERTLLVDAKEHAVVPKKEHQYVLTGLLPTSRYLLTLRGDEASLGEGRNGEPTTVLCIEAPAKPRPVSRTHRFLKIPSRTTAEDTTSLRCLLMDDTVADNAGAVEVDIIDAEEAKQQGVDVSKFTR